ncbi:MAG TPA: hypothetical protein VF246_01255 [Acidimicrobiia bacterium]
MRRKTTITSLAVLLVLSAALVAGAAGPWGQAVSIEDFGAGAHPSFNLDNSTEGCPFISPDGKRFFLMSTRQDETSQGGQDIWVSTRSGPNEPWSEPVNVGPPINSTSNDFCPTISADGKTFFFASNRPGHCGSATNADLYTAQLDENSHATSVTHLGCVVNSPFEEHSPFPAVMQGIGKVLLYSSGRPAFPGDTTTDHDIYMSPLSGGAYGPGIPLEINTQFEEAQPNLRVNGKELFFWSNRGGAATGPDIYTSTLSSDGWSDPVSLGALVNSTAPDTRPSLSRNGKVLYFGSGRSGMGDIYVTSR